MIALYSRESRKYREARVVTRRDRDVKDKDAENKLACTMMAEDGLRQYV